MRITFTKHALRRLLERDISMSDVEAALSDPDEVVAVRHGRLAARRHDPSCFNVVVIYEVKGEVIIVVTAMKVSERGLRKIGFSGVRS